MTTTLTYRGFAYRQGSSPEAPWVVSFVAAAEDLYEWAGIPRRRDLETGFQRIDDPARVKATKRFFEFEGGLNQSPTAIVLGIHKPSPGTAPLVTLNLGDALFDQVRSCTLTVTLDESSVEQLAARVGAQIAARLQEDDAQRATAEAAEEAEEEPAEEPEDEEGEPVIELGRSRLDELSRRLADSEWVRGNEDVVRDLAKPATVIDGQHRLLGARACERRIPFSVCAIIDCPWHEQVFQFTVMNYTQEGIPDKFITANAALSLTKGELDRLKARLQQADVKVLEYDLMQIVQFDPKSPFYERVDLSERSDPEKIGYKTMIRVAKAWYNASDWALKLALQKMYRQISGKGQRARQLELWRAEDWGGFFVDFWGIIREQYGSKPSHVAGKTLWDVGFSQLTVAIVLLELQAKFLEDLNNQDDEYFQVEGETLEQRREQMRDKLRQRAVKFATYIPADFFSRKWATTSLNTSAGRMALADVLGELHKSKGKYRWESHPLVTGKHGA